MPTIEVQANDTANSVRYAVVVQGSASGSSATGGQFNPNDAIFTSEAFPADVTVVTGGVALQGIDAFTYQGSIIDFNVYAHAGDTVTVRQDGTVVDPVSLEEPYQPADDGTNGGTNGDSGSGLSTGSILLGLGAGAVLLSDELKEDTSQADADVADSLDEE